MPPREPLLSVRIRIGLNRYVYDCLRARKVHNVWIFKTSPFENPFEYSDRFFFLNATRRESLQLYLYLSSCLVDGSIYLFLIIGERTDRQSVRMYVCAGVKGEQENGKMEKYVE